MSPEAITAPSTIDGRSDLYSLGGVAYFLLTGAPPFVGKTPIEVWGHHLHTALVPPSQRRPQPLAPALEALVASCLAKDREQRPASAAEVAARLAALALPVSWTADAARRWWDEQGARLRASAAPTASSSAGRENVAVDLAARGRV